MSEACVPSSVRGSVPIRERRSVLTECDERYFEPVMDAVEKVRLDNDISDLFSVMFVNCFLGWIVLTLK